MPTYVQRVSTVPWAQLTLSPAPVVPIATVQDCRMLLSVWTAPLVNIVTVYHRRTLLDLALRGKYLIFHFVFSNCRIIDYTI